MLSTRESTAARTGNIVKVNAGDVILEGYLETPPEPVGIVVFAHGSGSSRHSPRNRHVASILNRGGLGTLLFDLLTVQEELIDVRTRELRFDIPLLASRVTAAIDWIGTRPDTEQLKVGTFGASTGAAAALIAAANRPSRVGAVVSRGGRVDLAGESLRHVRAPTLCIVGELDTEVLALNRRALMDIVGKKRLEVIGGATHLFEEPGTLIRAAEFARDWFLEHLGS
ncbi:MAG: dienelactone hydrolase family protein [Gemmatimonadota bacterium]